MATTISVVRITVEYWSSDNALSMRESVRFVGKALYDFGINFGR